MSIFKDNEDRKNTEPKCSVEQSNYTYLNNSALPKNEIIRQRFNELFELYQYGDVERNEILGRIRGKDEVGYYSASFELIVNAILKNMGFNLVPHPKLNNGSNKHPDFLVTAPDGGRFYLELVTGIENDDVHINRFKEKLKKIKEKNPELNIQHHIIGRIKNSKDIDLCIQQIKAWIESKDYLKEPLIFSDEKFDLKVEVSSKILDVPFEIESSQIITNLKLDEQILSSLESKSTRYGQLDAPYVIAITPRPSDFSFDFSEKIYENSLKSIERSLFGKLDFPNFHNYKKGFWYAIENGKLRFRNSNVCAVWYFDELTVERLEQEISNTLYLSAHNGYPTPDALMGKVYFKFIAEFSGTGIAFANSKNSPTVRELLNI